MDEGLFAAVQKFAGGANVNFLREEGQDRVKEAYGENKLGMLLTLKEKHDPSNFFHLNQNIRPAQSMR